MERLGALESCRHPLHQARERESVTVPAGGGRAGDLKDDRLGTGSATR
jgi:hypothetical protein